MARKVIQRNYIFGFDVAWLPAEKRIDLCFKELKDTLNFIGVMSKRKEIPWGHTASSRPYAPVPYYYENVGCEYYVPKNWRDCLYEDLKSGHYYIITSCDEHPHLQVSAMYSWLAFRVTNLTERNRSTYPSNGNKEEYITQDLYHSGSFIDLIKERDINEVLDTLAMNEKPIKIKFLEWLYIKNEFSYDVKGSICQFDI